MFKQSQILHNLMKAEEAHLRRLIRLGRRLNTKHFPGFQAEKHRRRRLVKLFHKLIRLAKAAERKASLSS